MNDGSVPEVDGGAVPESAAHVRGSTLLVVGRLVSLGINFATQILIARNLSQTEFGAFALAFAIAGLAQVAITLGLHRGVTRFLTADLERGDHPRFVGTIVLNVAVIVVLGAILVGLVAVAQQGLTAAGILQPAATGLLLILVLLAPIDALDDLLISLYAIFDSPRSIFVRRYILGPALRLGVALAVVLASGGAIELAVGYVAASLLGLVLYGALFIQVLMRAGIVRAVWGRPLVIPAREVLGASVPLLSTDAVWLLINTFPIFVLTAASGLADVAAYQVIRPAAALNLLVAASFHVLYLPLATRLANRGDIAGSNELYWRTTIWVAVLTFPIFAATFALGRPLTTFAFGERYEASGLYLSVLAVGYMVHAALGFNATTLAAHGYHRSVAIANGMTAAISVVAAVVLIPPFGALGAAVASTATLFAQNALLQLGLKRHIGIALVHRDAVGVYAVIAVASGTLFAIESFASLGLWALGLAALEAVGILYLARHAMQVTTIFPGINVQIVRLLASTGPAGRRFASGLDLLRSIRPDDAARRFRQAHRWAAQDGVARAAIYRSIWTQAGRAIGADVTEVARGTFELRAGPRRATVTDHLLRLDSDATLGRAIDKPAVSRMLQSQGLPVPDHLAFSFADFGAAVAFLAATAGPCVVKPAHGRTGSGVTTNVRTPEDLLRAVVRAGADSDDLLIEHQLDGAVYRLLFLDGQLLDVLERRPPAVVGDGRSRIGSLIAAENERRLRAGGRVGLSLLKIDLDCLLTLAAAGLDLRSVPPEGTAIVVKTATNQSGALENRSILDAVGADLVEESRRAVELVGLRLAGVDVVTPDPVAPLAGSGGAILEVNGSPGIHYHYLLHPDSPRRPVAIPIIEALLDLGAGRSVARRAVDRDDAGSTSRAPEVRATS